MIPLTKRQRAAINEASKDRLSFASKCDYTLYLGGKPYEAEDLSVPEQDGPAVVLEGRILARLPVSLEHEECRVEHEVNGERITSYLGEIDRVEARGYYSTFLACTPSRYAEKTPLGDGPEDDLEYVAAEPSDALYEAASRLDYRGIEIPRLSEPPFTRTGDDGFRWTDSVSDVFEAVRIATGEEERESSGLVLQDTPLSVAVGRVQGAVLGDEAPAWTFEEGVDFDYGELSVASRIEGRYGKVVAYRKVNGEHEFLADDEVDNAGRKVRKDAVFLLEHEGPGAFEAVRKVALALSDNAFDLSFPCVYPPFFLDRGDPILIRGQEITADGVWTREYRARLSSVSTDQRERKGALKAVGTLVSESFEERALPDEEPRTDALMAPYGLDFLGDAYIDASLPWVAEDADGIHVVLDVGLARELGVEIIEEPTIVEVR